MLVNPFVVHGESFPKIKQGKQYNATVSSHPQSQSFLTYQDVLKARLDFFPEKKNGNCSLMLYYNIMAIGGSKAKKSNLAHLQVIIYLNMLNFIFFALDPPIALIKVVS